MGKKYPAENSTVNELAEFLSKSYLCAMMMFD